MVNGTYSVTHCLIFVCIFYTFFHFTTMLLVTFIYKRKMISLDQFMNFYPYLSDKPLPSNAFISPQWGGVMMYNVDASSTGKNDTTADVFLDMHKVMEVFVSQLRLLLDIQPQVSKNCFILITCP